MNSMKRFLAVSLVLATMSGFSACTVAREQTTERTVTPPEQPTAAPGEAVGNEMEQPVARPVSAMKLQQLKPGQPVSYYVQQFERMGYRVQDVDYQDDRIVYTVSKENTMEQVTLMKPTAQNVVQNVQVREMQPAAATSAGQAEKVTTQIQQLQPGKKPEEYIPMLDKYGTVTDYKLRRDRAVVRLQSGRAHYRVTMNLNPGNQNVTNIQVERQRWELPT